LAAAQVKDSLLSGQGFLDNATITAANIKNGGSNQSVFTDQLKSAPKQYQRAKKTPAILIILTILSGVGIVFLSKTWQKGLRHVGINLVVIGLIMLVFSWALNRTVSTKITPKIKVDNVILQQDVRNLMTDLAQQIDKSYWGFGVIYTLLGTAAIGGAWYHHKKSKPLDSKEQHIPTTAVHS